jgi:DNA-binding transcriptional regulator YiaG
VSPKKEDVRLARESASLTQSAAAVLVGSALRTWQDWESGARNMPAAKWELFQLKVKK